MKVGQIIKIIILGIINAAARILPAAMAMSVGILAIVFAGFFVGLLLAFPIKWAWNYAIVSTFALPAISWGKAWCLAFLAGIFIKSSK